MPLRILGEPAFKYTFLLLMHLQNAPEAGKGEAAQDGGDGLVRDEQRCHRNQKTYHKPTPPALLSQVVLHLDNCRVTNADAKEYGRTYYNSTKAHAY